MNSPIQILINTKPWTKLTEEVKPDPPVLRTAVLAFAIGLIGFALPWYSLSYTPPGGSITIAGTTITAFDHSYSGFSPEHAGLLMMPLGRFSIGEDIISGSELAGILLSALIAVGLATLFAVPALARFRKPAFHLLRLRWAQIPVNVVHAIALLIEAIGCLSFLLLALGIGGLGARYDLAQELGNTAQAVQAASYLHIDIGSGFWLVLISFLMTVATRAKQFFTTIAVILAGLLVLYLLQADQWIGAFLHSFGF